MAEQQLTLPGEIVKKSNALARAKWSVESVWEPRMVALVASMVRKDDEDFCTYRLPISEVVREKIDGRTYARVASVVDNIMGRVITIPDPKGWTKYTVFSKCRYIAGEGVLELGFHPDLKIHYLGLQKNFTKYSLLEFMMLPSIYSQRLFEVLKSWDDKPEKVIQLTDLHEMVGAPPSLRKKYPDFRRKVLEKAHKDIRKHTNLSFEWEPIKKGRKVDSIRFVFSTPRKAQLEEKKKTETQTKQSQKMNKLFIKAVECWKSENCQFDEKSKVCEVCRKHIPKGN